MAWTWDDVMGQARSAGDIPALFSTNQSRLSDEDDWRGLAESWQHCDRADYAPRTWRRWFAAKRPGREQHLMTDDERRTLDATSLADRQQVVRPPTRSAPETPSRAEDLDDDISEDEAFLSQYGPEAPAVKQLIEEHGVSGRDALNSVSAFASGTTAITAAHAVGLRFVGLASRVVIGKSELFTLDDRENAFVSGKAHADGGSPARGRDVLVAGRSTARARAAARR